MSAAKVMVLGSYVQALCLRVHRLPGVGESLLAEEIHVGPGGKGFNLAVGARRLGAEVQALMAVGEDPAGDMALAFLEAEGIPCRHLLRLSAPTAQGVGLIDPQGENCIVVYPGANALLQAAHIAAALPEIAAARVVCAQFEIPEAPILAAFLEAQGHGIPTLLNAAPFRSIAPDLLALTDVLVLNAREAEGWLDLPSGSLTTVEAAISALESVRSHQSRRVVVTVGAQGCVAREDGGDILRLPAYPVTAVDTVGAGDAFCAGLAVGIAERQLFADSLRLASACGALACCRQGVLRALPDRPAVERLLQAGKVRF